MISWACSMWYFFWVSVYQRIQFITFILQIFLLRNYSLDNSSNHIYDFFTFNVLLLIKSDNIFIGNPDSQG